MKILIITTYYPPDTSIAAVRPYMLAKYLAQRGHEITVLRSGEFYDSASDFFDMNIPVRVISYLGENSPAEQYARGEWKKVEKVHTESRISFLPEALRKPIAKVYHACKRPIEFRRWLNAIQDKFQIQKSALDAMREESFDIVFATYGQLENIYAGQYAAELFHCKLIQDFRDAVAAKVFRTRREYQILKRIQDEAVQRADGVTTVSEGLLRDLSAGGIASCPNMVLYNGYEPSASKKSGPVEFEKGIFSICYTGTLYGELSDFSPLLQALKQLSQQNRICLSNVKLHYAGADFEPLLEKAKKQGMEEILVNHGYVSRAEAERIQNSADLFLVLSWNTKKSQGILTGKFYEGIRAKRPILTVVSGDVPNSELNILNQKYHYGFCYEASREAEQFPEFCDFLSRTYEEKMEFGRVKFDSNTELASAFRYDRLAVQLEQFCEKIMRTERENTL